MKHNFTIILRAFVLSVITIFASACDKSFRCGIITDIVERTYRFEIINQSGIDLTLSFKSPAIPPAQIGCTTNGRRLEIAIAADEKLSWIEDVNIDVIENTAVNGFMWSWVHDLRIDYSDGVSVDAQSLPEDRRPNDMRAYTIIGTTRPGSKIGGFDSTARYVFTASDYRYAAECDKSDSQ